MTLAEMLRGSPLNQQRMADDNAMNLAGMLARGGAGTVRQEPNMVERGLSNVKRSFYGDKNLYGNDPINPSVLDSQYVSPEMAEGAVLDFVGGPMTFAGIGSKTANKLALQKAQDLAGQGVNRKQIWDETGWFNDVDGKWKYEIDDSGMQYNPHNLTRDTIPKVKKGTTMEGLEHPPLTEAYPNINEIEISDFPWRGDGRRRGQYVESTIDGEPVFGLGEEISLWDTPKKQFVDKRGWEDTGKHSALAHELQHAIQAREGFARGGSLSRITKDIKDASDRYSKHRETLEQSPWGKEVTAEMMQKYGVESPELAQSMWGRDLPDSDFLELFSKDPQGLAYFLKNDSRVGALGRERQDALDSLHGTFGYGDDPFKVYQRLAGEAEARNVQTRMHFTPEQRQAQPPWETLDVPEEELLVRMLRGE